jgi:hypothetical protein
MTPLPLFVAVVIGVPLTPSPAGPPADGYRTPDEPVQLTPPPADAGVLGAVFEFRPRDAGWTCPLCPRLQVTRAPFNVVHRLVTADGGPLLTDGTWCFRARYLDGQGESPSSVDRCFKEDQTPPETPVILSIEGDGGALLVRYVTTGDIGVEASGAVVCARSVLHRPDGGTSPLAPNCGPGRPWRSTALDGSVWAFAAEGEWSIELTTFDGAENNGTVVRWPGRFTLAATLPAPEPPFFEGPDGGRLVDGVWQSSRFFFPLFPGTATMRASVCQRRFEGGDWQNVNVVTRPNGVNTLYSVPPSPLVEFRYAVVDVTGAVTDWSPTASRLFDERPPSAPTCTLTPAGGFDVLATIDAGVDESSDVTAWVEALLPDGGSPRLATVGEAPLRLLLAPGTWQLRVISSDEAGNQSVGLCTPSLVIGPIVPDAGPLSDAGAPLSDAGRPDDAVPEADTGPADGEAAGGARRYDVGCQCLSPGSASWLAWATLPWSVLRGRRRRSG